MYEFHAQDGAALDLTADFSDFAYANISFFDAGRMDVLLHVSLRADQGIAVFNRRIGGVWGGFADKDVCPLPARSGLRSHRSLSH